MAAPASVGTYTRPLAEFALTVDAMRTPDEVQHEVARVVLDCLGCGVAGLVSPGGRIAVELVKDEHGPLEGRLIGAGDASLMPAAFANTVLINALDYDVYGPEGHVPPIAVGVAMAVADAIGASGAELFSAILAGLEVGGRVGAALRRAGMGGGRQLGKVRGHGHVVFAAAAAAGRLLRLTPDQMHHAFGIAGYSATVPTLRKFFDSPHVPMTKYDHLGLMSQNGIQAVLLAQRGFTGDLEVLEGDIGFWRFAGAEGCEWGTFTRDLGSHWMTDQISYKPYPAVLYTNPIIDAALQLVREQALRPDEIEHVEVRTARTMEGSPRKEIRHYLDAWLNSPYAIAAGLHDIKPRRTWLEPQNFTRPDLLALQDRVSFAPLREGEVTTTGNYWEGWAPVRVTIAARGQRFEGGRDYLCTMDDQELIEKFYGNVEGLMPHADAEAMERASWELSALSRSRDLTRLFPRLKAD
jgi:2-methylcitrate dehydratase PrpD